MLLKSNSKSTCSKSGEDSGEHGRDDSFGVIDVNCLLNCKDVDTNERRSGNDDYNYLSWSHYYYHCT